MPLVQKKQEHNCNYRFVICVFDQFAHHFLHVYWPWTWMTMRAWCRPHQSHQSIWSVQSVQQWALQLRLAPRLQSISNWVHPLVFPFRDDATLGVVGDYFDCYLCHLFGPDRPDLPEKEHLIAGAMCSYQVFQRRRARICSRCHGQQTKVQKVATKIQKERLLLSNPAEIVKQEAVLNSTWFPFLGTVSTLKAKDGLQIGHIMGLPFFVSPPPAISPASRTIVPAWLLLTTRKAEYSTLQPGKHTLKAATWHIVANCPFHILLLPLTHWQLDIVTSYGTSGVLSLFSCVFFPSSSSASPSPSWPFSAS